MKSRSLAIVDIPDPREPTVNFVYNFFVKDEKTNDTGDARILDPTKLTRLTTAKSLQQDVPRYNIVNFSAIDIHISNIADAIHQPLTSDDISKNLMSEETITNIGFAIFSDADTEAKQRLNEKLQALSNAMGIKFQDSDQSKKLSSIMSVAQSDVQTIISPANDSGTLLVNAKQEKTATIFDKAAMSKLQYQVNKRLAHLVISAADDASPLSKIDVIKDADKLSREFISQIEKSKLLLEDVEPDITSMTTPVATLEKPQILGISTIGYVLSRCKLSSVGTITDHRDFWLPGVKNTNYIDAEILYGTTYIYEVRTVARIDAIVEGNIKNSADDEERPGQNWRVSMLVASRPSVPVSVKTEEFQAPNEPDGVMYRFNYDVGRGLLMSWQIPSGRSRDTKYFQIFRRKLTTEPFVCIAMLDFDDSDIRTVLPEQVRPDRIFSYQGAKTFYQDTTFTKKDRYIYAIAAIDAHGMSSGYSVQTEVSFNEIENSLVLTRVSSGGAPKQYPNFYIDPRNDDNIAVDTFVQDAVFDSGRKTMKIYFTPDAKTMQTQNKAKSPIFVIDNVADGKHANGYTFHTINLDLQKSSEINLTIVEKK